jgi:hypothetical protein
MIAGEVKKEVGRKELALLGQSSAARNVAGGSTPELRLLFEGGGKHVT